MLSALGTLETLIRLADTSGLDAVDATLELRDTKRFGTWEAHIRRSPIKRGWGREGVRSEARAEQRLAPGGRSPHNPEADLARSVPHNPDSLEAGVVIVRDMQTSEPSVQVELDVAVPMRDGTRLRANVYRPPTGRWPVLLTRLPYGKDLPLGTAVLDPVQAARQGYVVIVQDTRGRLASEGEWQPFVNEAEDGVDTIAWAANLPYSGRWCRSSPGPTH